MSTLSLSQHDVCWGAIRDIATIEGTTTHTIPTTVVATARVGGVTVAAGAEAGAEAGAAAGVADEHR